MLRGVLARPRLTTPLLRVRNLSVETQTTRESSYSSGVGSPVESLVWTVDTRERWVVVSEISSSGECWGRGKNWEFVVRCEGFVFKRALLMTGLYWAYRRWGEGGQVPNIQFWL
jgi:hypothetical protein